MYEERLIFKEIEGFPEHHASTITVLPDGNLLAAWYSCDYEGAINEAIFYSRFSIDKVCGLSRKFSLRLLIILMVTLFYLLIRMEEYGYFM